MIVLFLSFLGFVTFCILHHFIVSKRTERFNSKLLADCNIYDVNDLKGEGE